MRGLAGMVVACAALLVAVPSASAGTYNVVSCRAPGAGGVNAAWTPLLDSFNHTTQPEGFELVYDCPGGGSQLTARSAARGGQDAYWSHSANHHFAAPAGTAITKLVIWRWGQMVKTDNSVNDWRAFGATDDGTIPLEGCLQGAAYECQFGAQEPVGSLSNASRAVYAVNTSHLTWGVTCNPPEFRSCQTARQSDGYPLASMVIYGSVVTITDTQAPTLKPAGPLLAAGWRRPSDIVTYDAADSTGIRSARLEIGGRTTRAARPCDYRRPAPCSNVAGGRIAVPAGVPDGTLAARIVAEDAAGNPVVRPADHQARRDPADRRARACKRQVDRHLRHRRIFRCGRRHARGPEQVDGAATGLSAPTSRTAGSPPCSTAAAPRASTCG